MLFPLYCVGPAEDRREQHCCFPRPARQGTSPTDCMGQVASSIRSQPFLGMYFSTHRVFEPEQVTSSLSRSFYTFAMTEKHLPHRYARLKLRSPSSERILAQSKHSEQWLLLLPLLINLHNRSRIHSIISRHQTCIHRVPVL